MSGEPVQQSLNGFSILGEIGSGHWWVKGRNEETKFEFHRFYETNPGMPTYISSTVQHICTSPTTHTHTHTHQHALKRYQHIHHKHRQSTHNTHLYYMHTTQYMLHKYNRQTDHTLHQTYTAHHTKITHTATHTCTHRHTHTRKTQHFTHYQCNSSHSVESSSFHGDQHLFLHFKPPELSSTT